MYICPSVMYPVRSGVGCVISVEKTPKNKGCGIIIWKYRKVVFMGKEKLQPNQHLSSPPRRRYTALQQQTSQSKHKQ
jgi:hypothetical protein